MSMWNNMCDLHNHGCRTEIKVSWFLWTDFLLISCSWLHMNVRKHTTNEYFYTQKKRWDEKKKVFECSTEYFQASESWTSSCYGSFSIFTLLFLFYFLQSHNYSDIWAYILIQKWIISGKDNIKKSKHN